MEPTITCASGSLTISRGLHGEGLSYRFDDILKVIVRTTGDGPFSDDIFYEIVTVQDAVVLPSQAKGMKTLVDQHLLKLPGFDYEAFIQAMGSTDDQAFVCFERA